MSDISLTVNGAKRTVKVDDDTPLVWVLRDTLSLTGTKFGCGMGVCGSCTILEKGKAIRSCQVTASQAKGRDFVTIEGLSKDTTHPCQRAWLEEDVAQCGFCQPGMILTACGLLREHPDPTDEQIDAAMSDSVCRCGTYPRIRKAIRLAAAASRTKKKP
jgi:aerobic-type carbon monoxide dehydrogenase small subunit (CoxS/CutS family)